MEKPSPSLVSSAFWCLQLVILVRQNVQVYSVIIEEFRMIINMTFSVIFFSVKV